MAEPELILVIEDEEGVRESIVDILTYGGYSVLAVARGDEGLKAFSSHVDQIHLIFLDVVLPDMSGLETMQRLRQTSSDINIVFSSGYDRLELERRLGWTIVSDEHTYFLQKPFTMAALNATVRMILGA